MMEPCLLSHSGNLCTLTIFPIANFSVLYEIEPQHICLASANAAELAAMGLPSPFPGCLRHLELLHWNGDVLYLTPNLEADVSLAWIPRRLQLPATYIHLSLARILQNSQLLQSHLDRNAQSLAEHRVMTPIVSNKSKGLSHIITQDSNHHWHDFLFTSTTTHKCVNAIFTPLLIIVSILLLLCVCNCWMYCHVQKVHAAFMFQNHYVNYAYAPTQP